MEISYPWETGSGRAETPAASKAPQPKRRGRRPAALTLAASSQTAAAPAWLYHHLTISGPAQPVAAFAQAARGAGVIPWRPDLDRIEEDVFNLAVSQAPERRNLTVAGCHILARQFRERVEIRQAKALALIGSSQACPFDLHVLLPVPETILQLGPAHPVALAWLSAHWGVSDGLRQVIVREQPKAERRMPAGYALIGYGFFTAGGVAQGAKTIGKRHGSDGETPHAAITQLVSRWPMLRFVLQPRRTG
jgi:hypothetical protein